jgi:hypothetical protein
VGRHGCPEHRLRQSRSLDEAEKVVPLTEADLLTLRLWKDAIFVLATIDAGSEICYSAGGMYEDRCILI